MRAAKDPGDWQHKVFQSRRVHSGMYSPSTGVMVLRFANGKEYEYMSRIGYEMADAWTAIVKAQSPGNALTLLTAYQIVGRPRPT